MLMQDSPVLHPSQLSMLTTMYPLATTRRVAIQDGTSSNNRKMAAVQDALSSKEEEVVDDSDVSSDYRKMSSAVYNDVSSNNEDVADALSSDEVLESESNAGTGEPNTSILKLYHLLRALRSNPLELAQFSQEEQVYISLLQR